MMMGMHPKKFLIQFLKIMINSKKAYEINISIHYV